MPTITPDIMGPKPWISFPKQSLLGAIILGWYPETIKMFGTKYRENLFDYHVYQSLLIPKNGKTNTTLPWNDWKAPTRILSCPLSSLSPRAPPHNKVSSDPRSVFSGCNAIPGMGTTRQGTITYPTKRGKPEIIDSKLSFLGGDVNSQKGNGMEWRRSISMQNHIFEMENSIVVILVDKKWQI